MNTFPYELALDQLELEYAAMTGDSNPPKQSIPLAAIEHDGSLRRYVNVMGAKLSDGTFGSKTVFVDELDNTTGGSVNHFGADGALLYSLPAALVTPLRCALMAVLCMRYRHELVTERKRKVVVIGRGELGVAICNTLWLLREELKIELLLSISGRHIYRNERRLLPGIAADFWAIGRMNGGWLSQPLATPGRSHGAHRSTSSEGAGCGRKS